MSLRGLASRSVVVMPIHMQRGAGLGQNYPGASRRQEIDLLAGPRAPMVGATRGVIIEVITRSALDASAW